MDKTIIQRLLDPNADIGDLETPPTTQSTLQSTPSFATSNIEYIQGHTPLVRSTSELCDGLFAQISTDTTAPALYPLKSQRVIEHIIYLNDVFTRSDPDEFMTRRNAADVIEYLAATSYKTAANRPVFKRLGYLSDDNAIWIDLGQPSGECVRVTPSGWTIEEPLHPLFVRFPNQRPLPTPVEPDDGEVSFAAMLPPGMEPEQQKLLLSAILGCFVPPNFTPSFGYPVIHLRGEAGAGKTTLARLIKMLVDNEVAITTSPPTKEDDLFVTAQASHLLSFDNMGKISPTISDTLCQISTASARTKRTLYTDMHITVLKAHSPLLLNGISADVNRPDLIDRSVTIDLKRINAYDADAARRAESRLPEVFGFLMTLLSRSLRNYETIKLAKPPRLATLAKVVAAAEPFGHATPFVELLHANQRSALTDSGEDKPIIEAMMELMAAAPTWTGTVKDLLAILATKVDENTAKSSDWPKSAHKLSRSLRLHDRILREMGIVAKFGARYGTGRTLTVRRLDSFDYQPPPF